MKRKGEAKFVLKIALIGSKGFYYRNSIKISKAGFHAVLCACSII